MILIYSYPNECPCFWQKEMKQHRLKNGKKLHHMRNMAKFKSFIVILSSINLKFLKSGGESCGSSQLWNKQDNSYIETGKNFRENSLMQIKSNTFKSGQLSMTQRQEEGRGHQAVSPICLHSAFFYCISYHCVAIKSYTIPVPM